MSNNYFLIKAGQKKKADLVYDSEPGAEVLTTARQLLEYDPNKLIFLNTATGNNANSGFTPALAKLTYSAAAAALGGGRTTIQVENNNAQISVPITAPTQMARGVLGTITMIGTNRRYSGATTTTLSGTVKPLIVRDPVSGRLGINDGAAYRYSDDNGVTWLSSVVGYVNKFGTAQFPLYVQELNGFSPIIAPDKMTAFKIATLPTPVVQNATIQNETSWINIVLVSYAPTIGQYVGVKTSAPYYLVKSTSYPAATGWEKLESPALQAQFDLGWYASALMDVDTAIIVLVTNGGAGKVFSKKPSDADFIEQFAMFGSSDTTVKKLRVGTALLTDSQGSAYLYINSVFMPLTSSPAVVLDAVYDETTHQIYITGANPIYSPDQRFVFVRDADTGALLYSWENTSSTGSTFAIQTTPTGLISTLYVNTFFTFNLFRHAIGTPKIQNSVAGFKIGDGDFSSAALIVRSCSKPVLLATAQELSANRCFSVTNTNNTQTVSENLADTIKITASPATSGAVKILKNTVGNILQIVNTAATGRELIQSNIVEGGISAAFTVTVSSGNTRGANVNAVFQSQCQFNDPKFVDFIDYKLQFESNGYPANSPAVARSPEFLNTQGKRRDLGAWSAYETNVTYIYDRAFQFLKPAEKNAVQHIKHNRADLHVSIDGTPDVATDPAGRWEELVLNYRSLPNTDFSNAVRNHIAFVDYLESLDNPACEIVFDPAFSPAASVTVNGTQPAGTVVLALQPSAIAGGDVLTIGGVQYSVLYVVGDSVVLSQPLAVGVADLLVVPVAQPVGAGVFQYVAPTERRLSRWYEGADDFFKGLQMRFVRKWVGG